MPDDPPAAGTNELRTYLLRRLHHQVRFIRNGVELRKSIRFRRRPRFVGNEDTVADIDLYPGCDARELLAPFRDVRGRGGNDRRNDLNHLRSIPRYAKEELPRLACRRSTTDHPCPCRTNGVVKRIARIP